MHTVDTLIVGSGPAGSAAATTLARGGREVLVVDRAEFPRDKTCGDGLTTMALRELEALGWAPDEAEGYTRVDHVTVRSPGGRLIDFRLPDTGHYAAVVPRIELDHTLIQVARHAGARVLEGHALESVEVSGDGDGAEVTVRGLGSLGAGTVIAADGMWSPTRRLLGLGIDRYLGDWHGFRQYFRRVDQAAASRLWVWFEPDLLPGYVWSFPLGGHRANVGFGILRGSAVTVPDMKALWPEVLDRPHIAEVLGPDAVAEDAHRAWPIPARVGELPLTHGPVMFTGDAAAVTDPLTGEGIGQALLTGRLAAEAALATRDVEVMGARYRREVLAHFRTDHRLAAALGRVLGHSLTARGALRAAGASDWTRRNFVRWMFEDYPRAILATPRRWSRDSFTRPGAFSGCAEPHVRDGV